MQAIGSSAEVYLYTAAADMRFGVDRLAEQIKSELKTTPLAGGYFVFFSKQRKKVRILYWDKDGYALWSKRLEAGAFKVEVQNGYEKVSAIDLDQILSGIDFSRIKLKRNVEKGLYN